MSSAEPTCCTMTARASIRTATSWLPTKPDARVIALPAYLGGDVDTIGIKWIASFPATSSVGRLVLGGAAAQRRSDGLSRRRLEGRRDQRRPYRGLGRAPRPLFADGHTAGVFRGRRRDRQDDRGLPAGGGRRARRGAGVRPGPAERRAVGRARTRTVPGPAWPRPRPRRSRRTWSCWPRRPPRPYVPVETPLRPGQVILNISLRDLPPELLLRSNNILDDVSTASRPTPRHTWRSSCRPTATS